MKYSFSLCLGCICLLISLKALSQQCNEYNPVKNGTVQRYLMVKKTGRDGNNSASTKVYDMYKVYFGAKSRKIHDRDASGLIVETTTKLLQNKQSSTNQFGFEITYIKNQERLYTLCVPEMKNAFIEYKEIYTTDVKVTGSSVVTEEIYRGKSIVPSSITSYTVPELEYNKRGTGNFNTRVYSCFPMEDDEVLNAHWETRNFSADWGGESMLYQVYEYELISKDTSIAIYGKKYDKVLATRERLFKSNSSYENQRLTTVIDNYYAQGIGLIKQVTTEIPSANSGWTFSDETDLNSAKARNITTMELISTETDISKLLDND